MVSMALSLMASAFQRKREMKRLAIMVLTYSDTSYWDINYTNTTLVRDHSYRILIPVSKITIINIDAVEKRRKIIKYKTNGHARFHMRKNNL